MGLIGEMQLFGFELNVLNSCFVKGDEVIEFRAFFDGPPYCKISFEAYVEFMKYGSDDLKSLVIEGLSEADEIAYSRRYKAWK